MKNLIIAVCFLLFGANIFAQEDFALPKAGITIQFEKQVEIPRGGLGLFLVGVLNNSWQRIGACHFLLKSGATETGLKLTSPITFTVTRAMSVDSGWALLGSSNKPSIQSIICSYGISNVFLFDALVKANKGTVIWPPKVVE